MISEKEKKRRKCAYSKRRYDDRLKRGVCPKCGNKRGDWILCARCLKRNSTYYATIPKEKKNEYKRSYENRRDKEGRCYNCGKKIEPGRYSSCEPCRIKLRKNARNRVICLAMQASKALRAGHILTT